MTTVLNTDQSWRWGYIVVVVLQGLLAICFGLTQDQWQSAPSAPAEPGTAPSAHKSSSINTLRLPVAWLGIALFLVHPGIQFTAGQWAYSLFTEARAVAPGTAGLWISVYWGSLTMGRLVLGGIANRLGVDTLLRLCIIGILLSSLVLWWNISDAFDFLSLVLLGFSLAPLFPSLISRTPERASPAHAANIIGFQVAAASVGIALVPGIAGVLAENLGLEIIGPFLVIATVLLLLLHEAIVRLAP
jgi:fucose permease